MIISLGYRVKSSVATRFRIWATKLLNEYIRKGFALDDNRLKNLGGGGYWKELIERIRDIRSSEKVFYRQVLDIYATSIDYDRKPTFPSSFSNGCKTRYIMRFMARRLLKSLSAAPMSIKNSWD